MLHQRNFHQGFFPFVLHPYIMKIRNICIVVGFCHLVQCLIQTISTSISKKVFYFAVYFSLSLSGGRDVKKCFSKHVSENGWYLLLDKYIEKGFFSARRGIFFLQNSLAEPQKSLFNHTGMFSNIYLKINHIGWRYLKCTFCSSRKECSSSTNLWVMLSIRIYL